MRATQKQSTNITSATSNKYMLIEAHEGKTFLCNLCPSNIRLFSGRSLRLTLLMHLPTRQRNVLGTRIL